MRRLQETRQPDREWRHRRRHAIGRAGYRRGDACWPRGREMQGLGKGAGPHRKQPPLPARAWSSWFASVYGRLTSTVCAVPLWSPQYNLVVVTIGHAVGDGSMQARLHRGGRGKNGVATGLRRFADANAEAIFAAHRSRQTVRLPIIRKDHQRGPRMNWTPDTRRPRLAAKRSAREWEALTGRAAAPPSDQGGSPPRGIERLVDAKSSTRSGAISGVGEMTRRQLTH